MTGILLSNDPHIPLVTNRLFRSVIRPNVEILHALPSSTFNTGHNRHNPSSYASQQETSIFPSCSSWRMPSIAIVSPMRQNNARLSLSSRSSTTEDDETNTESSSNISSTGEHINTIQRSPFVPIVEDISSRSDERYRLVRELFEDIDDVVYPKHQYSLPLNPPYCADVDSDGEPILTEPCILPPVVAVFFQQQQHVGRYVVHPA
ncbi:hypothetical protein FF38_05188 [Lucilia cuprina]|uniref:Uncharacterized protein n=1 Tax=Lucilia cuprina TaxID=7375 RepID=A0A0L0CIP0_LUCCU|nr:hypothetical protein FF38_05188 [Lucilia cuprina]